MYNVSKSLFSAAKIACSVEFRNEKFNNLEAWSAYDKAQADMSSCTFIVQHIS